ERDARSILGLQLRPAERACSTAFRRLRLFRLKPVLHTKTKDTDDSGIFDNAMPLLPKPLFARQISGSFRELALPSH
ncbi:MAG: hypothetical protein WC334_10085, partial [Kiritimatiellales bacterium]